MEGGKESRIEDSDVLREVGAPSEIGVWHFVNHCRRWLTILELKSHIYLR